MDVDVPRRASILWGLVLASAYAVIGAVSIASAQSAPAPIGSGNAPTTVLAHAAREIGISHCYDVISQVSERVFDRSVRADILLDWQRTNPDVAPFFSLSGIEFPQSSALLSLVTVPDNTGGCSVLAERISSAPLSCSQVAQSQLKGYNVTQLVRSVMVYTESNRPRDVVVLVDTPPSCLILRRQVQLR
ncbi:hypothetical protein [Burkholderia orbicola]|uniref:hypothetical protein n=1 Tax=Burkholderia orbicola TaxID=2978683 RepID=UPI003AF89B3E